MNKTTVFIGIGAALLLGAVSLIGAMVGTFNDFSRIENKVKACQVDNKNVLDNTRKSIREAAGVSDKEVEALQKIITGYADARGKNSAGDGSLVTVGSVREAVPGITNIETLKNLQNIVVAGRKDWQFAQSKLLDAKREGDDMFNVFPGNIILPIFGKKQIEVKIVTSSETESNFETGTDDSNWIQTKGEQ